MTRLAGAFADASRYVYAHFTNSSFWDAMACP
jgi:hypothetical protein